MNRFSYIFSLIILVFFTSLSMAGIPKMINYQGMLTDNAGTPLTDTINLTFKIYDGISGGNKKWEETQNNVPVINGLFNVILGSVIPIDTLSFSQDYWLDINVNGEQMGTRLKFTSVGYAYRAQKADTADYAKGGGGGSGSPWTFRITDGSDTTITTGGRWGMARYGSVLYGNTDSTHVNLGVACTTGVNGQNYKYCTVGGGLNNSASDIGATVGGGRLNKASNDDATVGGGVGNRASGPWTTIGGGGENTASNSWSTVSGGDNNNASQLCATVGGGYYNTSSGYCATVGGGGNNTATDTSATTGGGKSNTAGSIYTTIGGGRENTANNIYATIGGGYSNSASGLRTTIAGGWDNTASEYDATVGGGYGNTASGARATIAGGWANYAGATSATAGGGEHDTASNTYSTVGGGYHNNVSGSGATIPGGYENKVAGDYSFAAGRQVNITSDADYTFAFGRNFTTSTANAAIFYNASNPIHVGIGVTDPQAEIDVYSAVRVRNMLSGSGTNLVITTDGYLRKSSSSKRHKEDVRHLEISPVEILNLQPVRFKWKSTGEEDIGLVAEDVNEIIPDLVIYDKEGKPDAVKYDKITLYLLEKVKAQQQEIDNLKQEMEKMKSGGK